MSLSVCLFLGDVLFSCALWLVLSFFVVKKQGSLVQDIVRICCVLEDGRRGHQREQKAIFAVKRKQRS